MNTPERIWLIDMGGNEIAWAREPNPDAQDPAPDAVEYARVHAVPAGEDLGAIAEAAFYANPDQSMSEAWSAAAMAVLETKRSRQIERFAGPMQ